MKIRSIMAVTMAAAVAFAACSKETENNGGVDTTNGNNVQLKIQTPVATETRGEGDRVQTNAITLGEGHVFFTDATGLIRRHVQLKTTAAGANEIAVSDVKSAAGATVSSVPTSVTKCYIFANIPASTTVSVTENQTNISAVQALTMAVGEIKDTDFGVSKVPQWGEGNVGYNVDQTKYTTTVRLEAMGSRLQVLKLSAIDAAGGEEIVSYKVDGIFVNNYFANMPVGYGITASTITNNLSTPGNYGGASNTYTGGLVALADFYTGFTTKIGQFANAQTVVCTPKTANKVWAYNVWPTEGITGVDATTIPHLVIRLSDIVWNDGAGGTNQTVTDSRFVTVKGISAQAGASLDKIENGKAYTFTDIQFSYDNLKLVPEEENISAEVHVTEIAWEEVLVDPEL